MSIKSLEELYSSSPSPSSIQPTPPDVDPPAPSQDAPSDPVDNQINSGGEGEGTGDKAEIPANAAPPAASEELPSDIKGLQAALKAERSKRQEFGTKVSEYEKKLASAVDEAKTTKAMLERFMQQPPAQPQQPQRQKPQVPDPYEADAFAAWQAQEISNALIQRDNDIIATRVVMSQEMMKTVKTDYAEVEEVFTEEANRRAQAGDSSLWDQLYSSHFPARFAYEQGKRIKLMREMGDDPDKYIQSRIDAALAERLAKQAEETPSPAPQVPTVPTTRPALPQSLAQMPSTAPRNRPVNTGPVPLDQLYK